MTAHLGAPGFRLTLSSTTPTSTQAPWNSPSANHSCSRSLSRSQSRCGLHSGWHSQALELLTSELQVLFHPTIHVNHNSTPALDPQRSVGRQRGPLKLHKRHRRRHPSPEGKRLRWTRPSTVSPQALPRDAPPKEPTCSKASLPKPWRARNRPYFPQRKAPVWLTSVRV